MKLGFLLLLIAGPFFLIIGTHPGFGRIIAIRWFEMLVGVLMKQVAVALALSVLLYAYSLIMGTSDAVLPWALKILMIALVTVAVFIYRKPFQHLFSAVGYGVIGSQDRADGSLRQASTTFRRVTRDTATVAVPGVAAYRVGRWARRNPGEAAALAAGIVGAAGAASAGAAAGKMAAAQAAGGAPGAADEAAADVRPAADGQPGDAEQAAQGSPGVRPATAERARRSPNGDEGGRRSAPPLQLPPRTGGGEQAGSGSGWARTSAQAGAAVRSGEAPPRPGSAVRVTNTPGQDAASAGLPAGPGRPAGRRARRPRRQASRGVRRPPLVGGPARRREQAHGVTFGWIVVAIRGTVRRRPPAPEPGWSGRSGAVTRPAFLPARLRRPPGAQPRP